MEQTAWILLGFVFYAVLLAAIGYVCAVQRTTNDLVLGGRTLNRFLVAVAATSAGNSGFIMTGAVGLGYAYGAKWILLPLAWLLGDLVFWIAQPAKLNALARRTNSRSIPALLAANSTQNRWGRLLRGLLAIIVVCVAMIYACSQFLAAGKIFSSFTGISGMVGVLVTSLIVGFYSVTGGFRATVWTDVLQGILMVTTTLLVLVISLAKLFPWEGLGDSLRAVSSDYLSLTGSMSIGTVVGFIGGWACAAFGFGLSQPHLVLMYMAGKSPEETIKARWVYIFLLQFTWIGMTVFGMLARPLLIGIEDPETALAHFALRFCGIIGSIIIFNGVFSAIASTIDALVVSSAGTLIDDIFYRGEDRRLYRWLSLTLIVTSAFLGAFLPQSVFGVASLSVSLLACTIGPLVMLRLLVTHLSTRVTFTLLIANLTIAIVWRSSGLSAIVNEALPAIGLGLLLLPLLRWREESHKALPIK